ncbi:MAG: hypothetical protein HY776_00445 [Actinobacteria bacterium]|nr:hypothetical protein [Actinomycetota bacterium]
MSNEIQNQPGVVLDEPMARALLYAAVQEELLPGDPMIGNGFVRHLLDKRPSQEMIDKSLEQLVLGGRVHIPFWLPREWEDQLVEEGVILPVETHADSLVEVSGLSAELLLGMMESRGIRWSTTEYEERISRFRDAYVAWKAVADGKSFENVQTVKILSAIFQDESLGLSAEQLAAWEYLSACYDAIRPVIACMNAYKRC